MNPTHRSTYRFPRDYGAWNNGRGIPAPASLRSGAYTSPRRRW